MTNFCLKEKNCLVHQNVLCNCQFYPLNLEVEVPMMLLIWTLKKLIKKDNKALKMKTRLIISLMTMEVVPWTEKKKLKWLNYHVMPKWKMTLDLEDNTLSTSPIMTCSLLNALIIVICLLKLVMYMVCLFILKILVSVWVLWLIKVCHSKEVL